MSKRKMNPPIKGHTLIYEGHMHGGYDRYGWGGQLVAVGGCSCGYQPIGWKSMSIRQVQAWHREHKVQIRNGNGTPVVGFKRFVDLGEHYRDRVTAERVLTKEDRDMLKDMLP